MVRGMVIGTLVVLALAAIVWATVFRTGVLEAEAEQILVFEDMELRIHQADTKSANGITRTKVALEVTAEASEKLRSRMFSLCLALTGKETLKPLLAEARELSVDVLFPPDETVSVSFPVRNGECK